MKHLHERLERYGAKTLSTEELLSFVLRTSAPRDEVMQRIEHLLTTSGSLQDLLKLDFGQLTHDYGLSKAKAAQMQAVLELARRLTLPSLNQRYQITCAEQAAKLVMPEMAFLDHEEMRGLYLDTKNQIVANLLLYQGTVNSSVLRAAE